MKPKTLTVRGVATVSLPPDWIDLQLRLTTRAATYEQTLAEMEHQIQGVATCLESIGFLKTEIKTQRLDVSLDREQVKNEAGDYEFVIIGYVAQCVQHLSFDLDLERLSQVMLALKHCSAHPEFDVTYRLKDRKRLHSLLLEAAMEQAIESARVLATAGNVSLQSIHSIDYQGNAWLGGEHGRLLAVQDVTEKMELYPEEIEASDEVTVVFEIGD